MQPIVSTTLCWVRLCLSNFQFLASRFEVALEVVCMLKKGLKVDTVSTNSYVYLSLLLECELGGQRYQRVSGCMRRGITARSW